jgi:transcriptional regulator of NAD metabolism
MEKISWPDRVRNKGILPTVKDDRHILHTIKRRNDNRIGDILRRNCLLKHVIEGKIDGRIQVTERRGRTRTQLLQDLKKTREYWKLTEKTLDRTLWRTSCGRGYGPVVRLRNE